MNCVQMILMRLRPVRRPAYIRPVASLCCGGRKVHRRHHLGLMTEAFLGFMQLISVTPHSSRKRNIVGPSESAGQKFKFSLSSDAAFAA